MAGEFTPGVVYGAQGRLLDPMRPETLMNLGTFDIRKAVIGVSPVDAEHYTGPFEFQLFTGVKKKGIFPIDGPAPKPGDYCRSGISDFGAPWTVEIRYTDEESNPVKNEVGNFVRDYPYPHKLRAKDDPQDYYERLDKYQQRVMAELGYQISKGQRLSNEHPERGVGIYTLPFNGAIPVGYMDEQLEIPEEQMLPFVAKRIPLKNGDIICAGAAIELPEPVLNEELLYIQQVDDCFATCATQELIEAMFGLMGSKIGGIYYGGVIGTVHSLEAKLKQTRVPMDVSASELCTCLGDNGYMFKRGGKDMLGGDMGLLEMLKIFGMDPIYKSWGRKTKAAKYAGLAA